MHLTNRLHHVSKFTSHAAINDCPGLRSRDRFQPSPNPYVPVCCILDSKFQMCLGSCIVDATTSIICSAYFSIMTFRMLKLTITMSSNIRSSILTFSRPFVVMLFQLSISVIHNIIAKFQAISVVFTNKLNHVSNHSEVQYCDFCTLQGKSLGDLRSIQQAFSIPTSTQKSGKPQS